MKVKKIGSLLLLAILPVILVSCGRIQSKESANRTVRQTAYGAVKGAEKDGVLIWKGVPYGGETSGENRFKAPADPEKWSGERDATKSGQVALQSSADGVIGSEDALNLDIYRPDSDKEKLPVLVYIHGGNNQTGKSEEISGASFVKTHDAIFVSVNYRLGVLGFNPLPALKTGSDEENSGNYSLLDIAKSLDWIRGNIEAFGGDSQNVTVSGFSAGGRDVMAMLISPIFKGKFDKAVSFSGGMTVADEAKSQQVFAEALAPLAVEDGKKGDLEEAKAWLLSRDSAVRDYLQDLDAKRLAPLMGNAGIRMSVFPHLYTDGAVLPKEGFDTKNYNQVPLLMLTGETEFSLFAYYDKYFAQAQAAKTMDQEPAASDYAFVNTYGGQFYSLFNVQESAEKMAPSYKAPIYSAEIRFGEDAAVVGSPMSTFGSYHGVFVPLLDRDNQNYQQLVGQAYASKGAQELSQLFQDYLYQFISTGNPNGKNLPRWQEWTAAGEAPTLYLDATKEQASAQMGKKDYNYTDVLEQIAADTSISQERKEQLLTQVLNGRWFSYGLDEKYGNLSDFDKR
ncbi:Carboxylesterase, type B [Streptococcus sp. DD11]|uniref:carboxylesterase family protein n=1 Tax=Streptococcus sp. DD11 TaxID=1777879 RepID=UPI000798B037|nr:carboxylesterase family protein [Streptococcus sp. DD11]KXT85663.1 Carboxylesterase, type B [Streptococcus sp. DD11]